MEEKIAKIYDLTLKFLSFRPRSEKEIEIFLQKHKATDSEKEKVLEKLIQLKLINDEDFVKWWLDQRKTFRQKGLRVVKQELILKGVKKEVIDKVLEEEKSTDEVELAKIAAGKKYIYYKNLPPKKFYEKMARFLLSRGFNWETVKTVIDGFAKKE